MTTEQGTPRPKLSHELRTPLNHIIGYSEMLIEEAEDAGEADLVKPLQAVRQTGKQLLALVNDIFSSAKTQPRGADLREMLGALIPYTDQVNELLDGLQAAVSDNETALADLQKIGNAVVRLLDLIEHAEEYTTSSAPAVPKPMTASQAVRLKIRVPSDHTDRGLILVVDDNPDNREVLARQLERQGYAVVVAENGRQAIELVGSAAFDILLLDIMMPEMDGYEALRYLKSEKAYSHIPVIMISALDEIESVVRCIEMGAEDYLPKPFDPVLLRARIGACLEKKRLRDQEILYLQQVAVLTDAAAALEQNRFESNSLDEVAARQDALGNLARMFQHMAEEIYERERRLKREVQELKIEIDKVKQARQVADITDNDYFRLLQEKAHSMRRSTGTPTDEEPATE